MSLYPHSQLLLNGPSRGVVTSGPHFHVFDLKSGLKLCSTASFESLEKDAVLKSGPIRCASLSNDERYLAVTGDDKKLKVWNIDGPTLLNERELPKKPTCIQWTKDSQAILVSDKFGDIFSYALHPKPGIVKQKRDDLSSHENPSGGDLILGHTSLLTSFLLSPDEQYIISADRDEHIRVSWYPKGFNIEMYCLGHTKFVSAIHAPTFSPSILISGGGDPMLKIWEWMSGTLLAEIAILDAVQPCIRVRPDKRKRGWGDGGDEEGSGLKGRRKRKGKGKADDAPSTDLQTTELDPTPAMSEDAQEESSAQEPPSSGTTLVVHKIDSIESPQGNYIIFSAIGATAIFWCQYPDASSVHALDLGKPVVDFSITQNGQIWVSVDSEWSLDGTGRGDSRMVRLLTMISGEILEVDSAEAPSMLQAINTHCVLPATTADLKTLDLYLPLTALPKNPDAEHNAMDRDVSNVVLDAPEDSVASESKQAVSKKVLGRLKNKKKLLDRINAEDAGADQEVDDAMDGEHEPILKRSRSDLEDGPGAVDDDVVQTL